MNAKRRKSRRRSARTVRSGLVIRVGRWASIILPPLALALRSVCQLVKALLRGRRNGG